MTLGRTTFSRNVLKSNDDRMTISKMSIGRTMISRNIVRRNDSTITVSRMTISVMFSRNI
jgi:hypothetical protein